MWVLVKSGVNGTLDEEAAVWIFEDYDRAFDAMEEDIALEARERGVEDDNEEFGANYDDGYGFVGVFGGREYRLFDAEVQ